MKFFLPLATSLVLSGLTTALLAQTATPAPSAAPATAVPPAASAFKTDPEKLSYAIGMDIAKNLKQQGIAVDPQILSSGLLDAMTGAQPKMSQDEVAATLRNMQQTRMAKMQEARKAAVAANEAEGTKFLADNKAKPGVVTLADGLQYKVLTEGTGAIPKASDTVSVNYRGTLLNGTEFDSSYKRNEPATFQVGGVIKGWTEILQLMKTGAKYQVFIPGNLAYGDRGTPDGTIQPGATLIFEVELLSIK